MLRQKQAAQPEDITIQKTINLKIYRRHNMSRQKLNGLFQLAKEMRKAGAISSSEYQRIMDYLKKLSQKIGG